MSERDSDELRRILIAFDAASLSRRSLELTVELAARLQAELRGLFVEDAELLRLAELPFTRQFSPVSARGRRIDLETTERQLTLLAAQARRALEAAARRTAIQYSFDVVRGELAAALAAASVGSDLVVIEGACRPLFRYFRMAAPGRAKAMGLKCSVLLLEADSGLPPVVLAAFDGTEASAKALRLAARLAAAWDDEFTVLLLVGTGAERAALESQAARILGPLKVTSRFEAIPTDDFQALRARARGARKGLLVLSASFPLLATPDRERKLEALGCPILLVR